MMTYAEREGLLAVAYAYAFPANDDDARPEWAALEAYVEGIVASREVGR